MALGPLARPIESEWPWVGSGIVWFKSSLGGSNVHWGLKSHCSSPSAALNWFFFSASFHLELPAPSHPTPPHLTPFHFFPFMFHSTPLYFIVSHSTWIHSNEIDWLNDSIIQKLFIGGLPYTWYETRKGRQQQEAGKDEVPALLELERETSQ